MLSKQNRLKTRFEYNTTHKYGIKKNNAFTFIYILKPTNYKGPSKIGFVVSTKYHKDAVKRNKIKRQLRAIIRKLLTKYSMMSNNHWIVIHPKDSCLNAPYEKLSIEIDKSLSEIFSTN